MRRLVGLAVVGLATLAPAWANADDDQIAQDILQQLQVKKDDGLLKGFGIDLEVSNGTVKLKGQVASPSQQKLAVDVARHTAGVEKVVDELTVKKAQPTPAVSSVKLALVEDDDQAVSVPEFKPTGPQPMESHAMTSPMQAASPRQSTIPSQQKTPGKMNFFSNLSNGMSRAKGNKNVPESMPKPMSVRQVAHNDEGEAEQPQSNPAGGAGVDDDNIVRMIAQSLQREKAAGNLKGFNVDLNSRNGVVWVSGHVPNSEQHSRVIEIARRVKGVKQVVNDLKITNGERVGSVTHNDPSAPIPQGTGVAKRQVQPTPFVEAIPTPSSPRTNTAKAATAVQPAAPAQAPIAMQMVPVPMQMMQAPVGMYPQYAAQQQYAAMSQTPLAFAPSQAGRTAQASNMQPVMNEGGTPIPAHMPTPGVGIAPARYDHPNMPGYAWPSYAAYPNYAAVTYPKQYSPSAWPYIGPFYPYPQVPLGWRKVMLEWDDGWWFLDFKDK